MMQGQVEELHAKLAAASHHTQLIEAQAAAAQQKAEQAEQALSAAQQVGQADMYFKQPAGCSEDQHLMHTLNGRFSGKESVG